MNTLLELITTMSKYGANVKRQADEAKKEYMRQHC